jgi:DNA repair protein SbcC/Rad50
MIPIKLKITGFLSYRDRVELDFTGFSLACISGANGAGKSALLDAITWALFGQARTRGESVINNHPSVEAAEVTLDFDYEGNRYRVLRANPRGKTSTVEFFILSQISGKDDRWKPLTEHTLRETDKKIEQTLRMDFDTFTNASFFLQGKADQFATARPAERKRILGNILGLEVWERYREEAGQRRRDKEKEVKELDGRLSEVQAELDQGPERKKKLQELQANLAQLTKQRKERAQILENARRARAAYDEQRKMLAALQSQLEKATQDRDQTLATLEARRAEKLTHDATLANAEAIERAYQAWQAARQALADMEALAAQFRKHEALRHDPLSIIQAEEARLTQEAQGLQEQQTAFQQALSQAKDLEAQLETARGEIEAANAQLAQREELEKAVRQLQADQAEAKAENPRLKQEMHDLRDRIDRLKTAAEATCPVCGQPLSKEEREDLIRELTKEGEERRDRFYENKELLETFTIKLQKMGGALADLKGLETTQREATRQADQLEH